MKKIILIATVVCIIVVAVILVLDKRPTGKYRVVKIPGEDVHASSMNSSFWLYAGSNRSKMTALLLRDGSLINLGIKDKDFIFRYKKNDGFFLHFRFGDFLVYKDDHIVSIRISDEEKLLDWLKNIKKNDISHLRSIEVHTEISGTYFPHIKKIAEIKPDIGLCVEKREEVERLLTLFKPYWLIASNYILKEDSIKTLNVENIELICVNAESIKVLSHLKNLKCLILGDYIQKADTPFLKGNQCVESLIFIDAKMKNLFFLDHLTQLRELNLTGCKDLSDIQSISKLSNLEILCFSGCEKVSGITAINGLKSLKWLSLPKNISQGEFNSVINNHPDLEILEIIGCKGITDLSPIKKLKKLVGLILCDIEIDFKLLKDINNLRYVSIPEDIYSEYEKDVSDLEKALPECIIIPGHGVCLGSGWLLLLFPGILLFRFIFKIRKKK